MPEDVTEAAENIEEMTTVHYNGFDNLWYIMKVVPKIMDAHRAPVRPKNKGSLLRHAGV